MATINASTGPDRNPTTAPPRLVWMDHVATILDDKFRIPFTNVRFGLDFVMGLVPYAGDIVGFLMAAMLLATMVRYGASGRVLFWMVWNVVLDMVVGGIPILGDIFDLRYKANRRNFNLLREHYQEGRHTGSAWPFVLLIFLILMTLLASLVWLLWQILGWLWSVLV